MDEFPGNSHAAKAPKKSKDDEKVVTKVVAGEVIRRKTPLSKKFKETFMGGDSRSVGAYILLDVMLPAAKDMIVDATSQGIERMVFGESRRGGGRRPSGQNGYVSYNRYSSSSGMGRREESRDISRRGRANHNFDEIVLQTRTEAETVIDRLFDLISQYDTATVADLYELVGISGQFTDVKWGWTDLRGSGVSRVRNGYLLDLPKPEPLD